MLTSPIADWAFASAMGTAGTDMNGYLAARDSLRRAQARGRGLAEALSKAEGLGLWARTYFIPDLCSVLRGHAATAEAAVAKRILLDLISGEEAALRGALARAVREVGGASEAHEISRTLELAAQRWLETENPVNFSELMEYTDIEVFIAPALILGLEGVIEGDEGAETKRGLSEGTDEPLNRLRRRALAGDYGRFPFLLAIDLAVSKRDVTELTAVKAALIAILRPTSRLREKVLTSPDILARLARLRFDPPGKESNLQDKIDALAKELVTLETYREVFAGARGNATGVTLWHDALLHLMVDLDAAATARLLGSVWLPRIRDARYETVIRVPLPTIPEDLPPLLNLVGNRQSREEREVKLVADPAADLGMSGLLLSPWLEEKSWTNDKWVELTSLQRWRWLSGLSVDIRIIEALPLSRPLYPFALHLLGNIANLWRYRAYSGPPKPGEPPRPWERNDGTGIGSLAWLARSLSTSATEALSGNSVADLESLIGLLEEACHPAFTFPNVDPSEVNPNRAERLRRGLATGALRLVEQAMGTSWRGWDEGWPGAADKVLELHAPFLTVRTRRREGAGPAPFPQDDIIHGLIARYRPGPPCAHSVVDSEILDSVMDEASGKYWAVRHRRLLLAPLDQAARWIGPSNDDLGPPPDNVRLTRALMRVDSAWEDPTLDPAIMAEWRQNLQLELGRITDPIVFDQFIRLQLMNMIARGIFNEHPSELFAAIAPLITFGRPLQIRSLIQAIVAGPAASDHSGRVRIALYHALTRFLAANEDQQAVDAFRPRILLLRQLKAVCLFASSGKAADAAGPLLREAWARDAEDEPESFVATAFELGASAGDRIRALPFSDPWIAIGTAELLAADLSRGTARLLQSRRPVKKALNAFARPGPTTKGPHLGVVQSTGAGHMLEIRFTSDKVATVVDPREKPSAFGDLVVVSDANRAGPALQQVLPPGLLTPVTSNFERNVANIEIELRDNQLAAVCARAAEGLFAWRESSLNFAWLAQKEAAPYEILLAGEDSDPPAVPAPMIGDVSDLLAEHAGRIAQGECIILCLHALPVEDSAGLMRIVLEDKPLRIFDISMDFGMTSVCRTSLLTELERLAAGGRDPLGLLISFRIAQTELGPQLELAPDDPDGAGDPVYPGFRCPFDDRNLWWRDRFETDVDGDSENDRSGQGVTVLAEKAAPFLYVTEIDSAWGFPSRITIGVDDRREATSGRGKGSEAFIELIPRDWNPWNSSISGTIEPSSNLDLPAEPEARQLAIRELDELRAGTILSLSPAGAIRDDGRIHCRTAIGLAVPVNAESVSMRVPCHPAANWPAERKAVLTYLNWQEKGPRLAVPVADVPAQAIAGGQARGYFVKAPREVDGPATCQIAWLDTDGAGISESEVTIEPPKNTYLRLGAGYRLSLRLQSGQMVGKVAEPVLVADAVWHCEEDPGEGGLPEDSYIGSMDVEGRTTDVHELGQGRFVLRPVANGDVGAGQALQRFAGISEDQDYFRTEDRASSLRHVTYNSAGRRCAVKLGKGTAAGMTAAQVIKGAVRLTGLQLRRYPAPVEGGFIFERRFQMLPERDFRTGSGPSEASGQARTPFSPQLLLARGEVEGRFDPKTNRLRLHGDLRFHFPAGIEIGPNLLQRAPFGPRESFPGGEARAKIVSSDPLCGSFVDTNPRDFEELRARLLAAREDGSGALNPDEIRLVFVGRKDERDETTGEDVEHYLFEWGYGLWLSLPTSRIRYREESIETARGVLFFGDTISAAEVQDGESGPILVITAITQSRAHDLYLGSRDFNIVNVLDVAVEDGNFAIRSIEGFDPRYWPGRTGPDKSEFLVPHAQLDEDGKVVLLARNGQCATSSHTIIARLDTDLFDDTLGETLLFRHARLDLEDESKGLRKGDRVMLVAGLIDRTANDYGLIVCDPGLHRDDVASPFRGSGRRPQMILRRQFSLREQALGDIFELDGPDALKDDRLMVRLDKRLSLNEGSLERNSAIVRQLLRGGGELLATFGGNPDPRARVRGKLRFELQPGVIVGLDLAEVEGHQKLLKGDVARLRLAEDGGDRVIAELALPGDLHFVRKGRPAIILARHVLANPKFLPPYPDRKTQDEAMAAFSVGDLSGLTPEAAATVEDLESFMFQHHPKTGQLSFKIANNPNSGISFSFGLPPELTVGALHYSSARGGRAPQVAVVQNGGKRLDTDWFLLSYRDGSSVELEWQISNATWTFHDRLTVTWMRKRNGAIVGETFDVLPVSAARGPLIFGQASSGSATLRRPRAQLSNFAIGPTALLPPLYEARFKAGISVVVAASDKDGVVVELFPGRLVRLPGGIARMTAPGGTVSLQTLDWQAFGPGDQLHVRATVRPNALAPIEFDVKWSHGPRVGFGPRGAILARDLASDNASRGAAVYGTGAFKVSVPSQDISRLPLAAIVGGDEALLPMPGKTALLRNCAVLLVETGNGRLGVHGMPEARVSPSPEWAWQEDSFLALAIGRSRIGLSFVEDRLIERIRRAGGALPFTVEDARESTLLLSRRHQSFRPGEGRFILALPEGEIAGSGWMQMRVGGRHFAVRGDTLLPGIPAEFLSSALAALTATGRSIALRTTDGRLECGYRAAPSESLTVSPWASVGADDRFNGLICEGLVDGKLRWLPAAWAAACDFSLAEAKFLFESPKLQSLQVTALPNGTISVIHQTRATAELAKLKLGATIFVDILEDATLTRPFWNGGHVAEGWMPVVAQSKQTSLLFAAVLPKAGRRQALQAEVAVRHESDFGIRILLTAAGERLVPLDGPGWLFGSEAPQWEEAEAVRFLQMRGMPDSPAIYVSALDGGGDIQLRSLEAMRAAYIRADSASLLLGLALAVAADPGGETHTALLRSLFARALRSIPIEHLTTWALKCPAEVSELTLHWRDTLTRLFRSRRLREVREASQRWLHVITLAEVNQNEEAIAHAFAAVAGVPANLELLVLEARFLPRVLSAVRPVYVSRNPPEEVVAASIAELRKIAFGLIDEDLDIPLNYPILTG